MFRCIWVGALADLGDNPEYIGKEAHPPRIPPPSWTTLWVETDAQTSKGRPPALVRVEAALGALDFEGYQGSAIPACR
jgi:hypothetical protein